MSNIALLHIATYLLLVLSLVKPLGWYIAMVYQGSNFTARNFLGRIEGSIYRFCNVEPSEEMDWKQYLSSMLLVNFVGILIVYSILRLQDVLPLNPQGMISVEPVLAFNIAVSFVTNTDWQAYAGENTISYFTQCFAFTVQFFLSSATSLAILLAFIRGLIRSETSNLGNFWVDSVRSILYILLPLSSIFAVILVSQGVIQNFNSYTSVSLLEPITYQQDGLTKTIESQLLPMGPVASQEAIKQLGSNGGGIFNTNSAHPFENPTTFSNLLEMMAIILLPASLCYTFGILVNDRRQGWMLLFVMCLIFVPASYISVMTELAGNPNLNAIGIVNAGNMEGKELRIGIINSAVWSTATTATSNGSVNSMLDSQMPLSHIVYLMLMHIGEIVFGGVGSGLYSMLMLVIITVFIAGLMVGRTPEYLGKKIEPFEMKMVSIVVLILPLVVLLGSAFACVTSIAANSVGNPGPHGLSEILYAFSSLRNNNGSALAGLNANNNFYNLVGAFVMLINRYWLAIATLAVAGSLARKKYVPGTAGTLDTHSPLFVFMLIGVIIVIGAISFIPTLALGPIAEHLMLWSDHVN